jgi:ICE2
VPRLSNFLQVLLFLPLTLSTLSKPAFLLLSLLVFLQSLVHGTLQLLWGSSMLPAMQLPIQPILLLVCFNIFSQSVNPLLLSLASWWGTILTLSSPLFIILESVSSLLVVQKLGQVGRDLVFGKGEVYQFVLLIASAVAYVASAWWIVVVSLLKPF